MLDHIDLHVSAAERGLARLLNPKFRTRFQRRRVRQIDPKKTDSGEFRRRSERQPDVLSGPKTEAVQMNRSGERPLRTAINV